MKWFYDHNLYVIRSTLMNSENPQSNSGENNSRAAKQIFAILCVALIIIVISAVFIIDKINEDNKKNEQTQMIYDNISSSLDSNQQEAAKIKENLNTDLIGTYKSFGYDNEVTIELKEGGVFTVISTGEKGWWSTSNKNGLDIIGLVFQNSSDPYIYQVYGSRLIDTTAVYTGDVEIGKPFDSVMTLGDMRITLKENGKAEGRFRQVIEQDGMSLPYDEAYGGSYTVDGEFIDLTLNGEASRFILMDYEDENIPDGMASLYYEKLD